MNPFRVVPCIFPVAIKAFQRGERDQSSPLQVLVKFACFGPRCRCRALTDEMVLKHVASPPANRERSVAGLSSPQKPRGVPSSGRRTAFSRKRFSRAACLRLLAFAAAAFVIVTMFEASTMASMALCRDLHVPRQPLPPPTTSQPPCPTDTDSEPPTASRFSPRDPNRRRGQSFPQFRPARAYAPW